MALIYWWMLILGALVLAAAIVLITRRRRGQRETRVPVAHGSRLTGLPAYQRALARHTQWLTVVVMGAVVLALAAVTAAARPAQHNVDTKEVSNRDIMLCLDVSGSMTDADAQLAKVFTTLAREFHGERVGLTIFDSSYVQVFPLTDDYDFATQQLKLASDALSGQTSGYSFYDGTFNGNGSSLIGDGVAGCVSGFPKLDSEKRSRSIILATDNVAAGTSTFTFPSAADLAAKNNIRIYGINPHPDGQSVIAPADGGTPADEMQKGIAGTGGQYFTLDDRTTVAQIVAKVQATEAGTIKAPPVVVERDTPEIPLLIALLGAAVLLFGLWRLRP